METNQVPQKRSIEKHENVAKQTPKKIKSQTKKLKIDLVTHSRFDQTFEILNHIGTGGYGNVWKVKHKSTNTLYAMKIIKLPNYQKLDAKQKKVWDREVETLSQSNKISGDHVVRYFDSWIEEKNCLYIQLELCSDNLKNIIEEKSVCFGRKRSDVMTPLEYFISSQLFKELLECVQSLHESKPNIIHRDLKPGNVLISKADEQGRFLKLCDFGLATTNGMNTRTHTEGQGTINYMAPEVTDTRNNKTRYTVKVDIYSLGKIAQELFGFNINDKRTPRKNKELASKWKVLKEKVIQMLNTIYRERPTCAQLLQEFDSWGISIEGLLKYQLTSLQIKDTLSKFSNQFFRDYFDKKLSVVNQSISNLVNNSNNNSLSSNTNEEKINASQLSNNKEDKKRKSRTPRQIPQVQGQTKVTDYHSPILLDKDIV